MGHVFAGSSKAADAPEIEAGVYDAKFDGVSKKFIKGGEFGDGDRLEWAFTVVDAEGAVVYDGGDPLVLTQLSSLSTNVASKTTPKGVKNLKAIMTPAEFAEFAAGNGIDEKVLIGRIVQIDVQIKENGWPTVATVLPARKIVKAGKIKPTAAAAAAVDEE